MVAERGCVVGEKHVLESFAISEVLKWTISDSIHFG
jgi:hypothetical protein